VRTARTIGLALVLLGAREALACAVCFGNPDEPMARAATTGVWFLLGVVLAVQAGFGFFFFGYLRKRLRIYRNGSLKPVLRLVK
jgi:hypothetical protein